MNLVIILYQFHMVGYLIPIWILLFLSKKKVWIGVVVSGRMVLLLRGVGKCSMSVIVLYVNSLLHNSIDI